MVSADQIPYDAEVQGIIGAQDELFVAVHRVQREEGTATLLLRDISSDILRVRNLRLASALRTCWEGDEEPASSMDRLIGILLQQFDADHAWIWETSDEGVVHWNGGQIEAASAAYELPQFATDEIPLRVLTLAEPVLYSSTGFAQFSTSPPNGLAGTQAHYYLGAALRPVAGTGAILLLERTSQSGMWSELHMQMLKENIDRVVLGFETFRLRQSIATSSTFLDNVLKSTDAGVLVLTRGISGMRVSLMNERFCGFFQLSREVFDLAQEAQVIEVLGSQIGDVELFRELLAEPRREHTCEVVTTGENSKVLQMFSTPTYDTGGDVFGRLFLFRDITRDKEVERQLLHSQKMESIGTLAGGIAHDFNNLLTTMLGYSELLRRDIPESDPAHEKVEQIERSARRAAELTSNLLAFSRRTPTQMQVVDVGLLIQKTMGIIRFSVPSSIDIRLDLEETLPCVEADETQLEQVLLNLVINARDALPDEKGVITIQTWLGKDSQKNSGSPPGDYVVIEVDDNGVGISPQELGRIFEPFYTTKEVGRGTGLGLSMVYGIVKQHNGFIEVASAPSLGSTFSVYIPATAKRPTPALQVEKPKARPPGKKRGRVLVVDDEKDLLEFCAMSLEERCDHVFTAADGLEGLRIVEEKGGDIDLVILDLTMPRMGGVEAFYRMRKIDPKLKVVITSGYSLGAGVSELLQNGACAFLQKPYTIDSLQRIVDSCMRSS
jgi:signal transduction histidine kinase